MCRPTMTIMLLFFSAAMSGCGRGASLEEKQPVRIEGEVFLDGPDGTRTSISCGEEFAVALARIIDEGEAAPDGKHQGIAGLTMTYKSGKTDAIEITDHGLVRVKGVKTVQTDLDALRKLLQRAVDEAVEKGKGESSGMQQDGDRSTGVDDASGGPRVFEMSSKVTEEALRPCVGKRVIIRGFWAGPAKTSIGYVRGPEGSSGQPIYLKATGERGIRKENELARTDFGTQVEVTGVLRLFQSPPASELDPTVQNPVTHFYLDVEEAGVKFMK